MAKKAKKSKTTKKAKAAKPTKKAKKAKTTKTTKKAKTAKPAKKAKAAKPAKKAKAAKAPKPLDPPKPKAKPKPRKLTPEQKRRLRKAKSMLLDRRSTLLNEIQHEYAARKDRGESRFADESDMASDIVDGEMALQVAQNESGELAQIDEALQKIVDGTYGRCEGCNKGIPAARLEVLPFATLCVRCKEMQEAGQTLDADAILADIEFGDDNKDD